MLQGLHGRVVEQGNLTDGSGRRSRRRRWLAPRLRMRDEGTPIVHVAPGWCMLTRVGGTAGSGGCGPERPPSPRLAGLLLRPKRRRVRRRCRRSTLKLLIQRRCRP